MSLLLQPIQIRHAPALQKLVYDPLVMKYLSGFDVDIPYELSHAVSFCDGAMIDNEDGIAMHRVLYSDNTLCGYIGLRLRFGAHWGTAELEYWLGSEYFGRGIMPAAMKMLSAQAFLEHPHLQRIQCSIPVINKASCRAAEKAGYTLEAVLKESLYLYHSMVDECIYSYLRQSKCQAE